MNEHIPLPTDAELAILNVLWEVGPTTVRDVHERLSSRGTGYTTTLKLMQLMLDKTLVDRDASRRTHVYRAISPPNATQQRLVDDLAQRAFGGSAAQLAMRALSAGAASEEELAELRGYLDALQGGSGR